MVDNLRRKNILLTVTPDERPGFLAGLVSKFGPFEVADAEKFATRTKAFSDHLHKSGRSEIVEVEGAKLAFLGLAEQCVMGLNTVYGEVRVNGWNLSAVRRNIPLAAVPRNKWSDMVCQLRVAASYGYSDTLSLVDLSFMMSRQILSFARGDGRVSLSLGENLFPRRLDNLSLDTVDQVASRSPFLSVEGGGSVVLDSQILERPRYGWGRGVFSSGERHGIVSTYPNYRKRFVLQVGVAIDPKLYEDTKENRTLLMRIVMNYHSRADYFFG